jgi:hypothetical protein
MKRKDRFHRYYDFRTEVTFHGRVYAPTLRDGVAHVRAVVARRLTSAAIRGDKEATIDGFTSTGIVVSARSPESQRAEREQLKALAMKYPRTALAAVSATLERKRRTRASASD